MLQAAGLPSGCPRSSSRRACSTRKHPRSRGAKAGMWWGPVLTGHLPSSRAHPSSPPANVGAYYSVSRGHFTVHWFWGCWAGSQGLEPRGGQSGGQGAGDREGRPPHSLTSSAGGHGPELHGLCGFWGARLCGPRVQAKPGCCSEGPRPSPILPFAPKLPGEIQTHFSSLCVFSLEPDPWASLHSL